MKKLYLVLFSLLFAAGTFTQDYKVMVVSALAPDDPTDYGRVQKFMDTIGSMDGIQVTHVPMANLAGMTAGDYTAYDAAIVTENGGSANMRAFGNAGWLIPAVFLKAYALHSGDNGLITNEATMWFSDTKYADLLPGINEMVVRDNSDVLKCYNVGDVITWTGGFDTEGTDGTGEAHVQTYDFKSSSVADIVSSSTALADNKYVKENAAVANNLKTFLWKIEENSKTKRMVTWGVHHGFMMQTTPDFWNIMRSSLRWVLKQEYTCPGAVGVKDAEIRPYRMYPNPVADRLNFSGAGLISNIDIIDITGKVLVSMQNDKQSLLLVNTGSLVSGMYFVRVNTIDGKTYTDKLVK